MLAAPDDLYHLTAPPDCATLGCNVRRRSSFPSKLNDDLRKRGYPPYLKEKFEKDRERNKFKDRPGDCRLLDRSESARGQLWAAAMTGISGSIMFNGEPLRLDPDLLALPESGEDIQLFHKWAEKAKAARYDSKSNGGVRMRWGRRPSV